MDAGLEGRVVVQGTLDDVLACKASPTGQFLAKLWRSLVYKSSGPQLYLTRAQDVEHQAYTMLLWQSPLKRNL
jgi:hypothetical protein